MVKGKVVKPKDPLGQEMYKLLKIFGIASLGFVFLLSFFNEKRANNSDEDKTFRITDASRIYFKNVRRAYYEQETHREAKMDIFRLIEEAKRKERDGLDIDLIINRNKNAAYLYLVPQGALMDQDVLIIRWKDEAGEVADSIRFSGGNRYDHLSSTQIINDVLEKDYIIEVKLNDTWQEIYKTEEEKDALKTTFQDFLNLVEYR